MIPPLQFVSHHQFSGESVLTDDNEVNVYFYAFSINLIIKTWLYAGIKKLNQHFYYPSSIWQVAISKTVLCMYMKSNICYGDSHEIKSLRAKTGSH